MSDKYTIIFTPDEISLTVASDPTHLLTFTADEAKEYIISYYRRKADYIFKQTLTDFMHDQGFYGINDTNKSNS